MQKYQDQNLQTAEISYVSTCFIYTIAKSIYYFIVWRETSGWLTTDLAEELLEWPTGPYLSSFQLTYQPTNMPSNRILRTRTSFFWSSFLATSQVNYCTCVLFCVQMLWWSSLFILTVRDKFKQIWLLLTVFLLFFFQDWSKKIIFTAIARRFCLLGKSQS